MTEGNSMFDKLKELIEKEINPQLELHAGGCELMEYDTDNQIATIRLYGGCSGCPSSHITLFNGIVPIIKEKYPEVQDVVLG